MATLVWCARACYPVQETLNEVTERITGMMFVELTNIEDGSPLMLNVTHISSYYPHPNDVTSSSPGRARSRA